MLIGFGMAGGHSASATYVIESWQQHLRNKASAFLTSGFSLGGVLMTQLYRVVVPAWSWRGMFAIGLVPVALALWLRRALPEPEDFRQARRQGLTERTPNMFTAFYRGPRTVLNVALSAGGIRCAPRHLHRTGAEHDRRLDPGDRPRRDLRWFLVQLEPER